MKTRPSVTRRSLRRSAPAAVRPAGHDLRSLVAEVRHLIQTARHTAAATVNTLQVLTNFEIGRRIVEHEQQGERRAEYGSELLKTLSVRLTEEFGKGFSPVNLSHMRRFFVTWEERVRIFQQPAEKLKLVGKSQQPAAKSIDTGIGQKPSGKLVLAPTSAQSVRKSPFALSWTHYVELLSVKDPAERSFYEIEAAREGWSVPELRRQKASCLYERLALSRDKLAHQDLGQMQMYVNYYDRHVKRPEENPTVGLLLCKEKKDAVVRLTLPADTNIHAREYQLYLPSKALLRRKLLDWTRTAEAAR